MTKRLSVLQEIAFAQFRSKEEGDTLTVEEYKNALDALDITYKTSEVKAHLEMEEVTKKDFVNLVKGLNILN